MKIFVTGAGGFIGSHLVEQLVEAGHQVKALVKYNSNNNWGWLEDSQYKQQVEVVLGNVRDYDSVYAHMKGSHAVFHLAALIGIPYSYLSPKAYIETNITGTYNILNAAKELELDQILVTSTSETYGTAQYTPICENHPLVGQSPYSATKIGADQIALSHYLSFDMPVKIVRPFNTYGPRQSARAIIPTIISQILKGKKSIMLGSLEPTRDFTFVKDTAKGFIDIFESDKVLGQVTNIGMDKEISVGDLVKLIGELMDEKIDVTEDPNRLRPTGSEVMQLRCCNKKIIENTTWTPDYNIRSGLLETINWVKENQQYFKADKYNV
jgi:NAD dependent epimerase/dehydratase